MIQILEPSTAKKFQETLMDCELDIIDECGHVPHLEKPIATADAILEFVGDA